MSERTSRRRLPRAVLPATAALLCTAALAHSGATASIAAAASYADGVTSGVVFERGESGYHSFRIPAIIEVDGVLLAFAEGRVNDATDNGDIDMVLKRSFDGGLTWGSIQVLADDANKWGNPVPMVTADGDLVLNMTRTGGNVTGEDVRCGTATEQETRRSFMLYSSNNGATWTGLTEITAAVRPSNWGHFVGGPGHGVTMTQGDHPGRLIIPGNHSIDPPPGSGIDCLDPRLLGAHILYSDNDGVTWELGAVDQPQATGYHPHESTATELDDGTIYMNSRDQRGDSPGLRVDTTSSDAGETFDATFGPATGVMTSEIGGSVINLPDGGGRLVLSTPGHPTARENLTLWSSFDDGASWQESLQVYDGPSGYSDLVDLGSDTIGVLFENGERLYDETELFYSHLISFARVPVALLDGPTAPEPVTPDVSASGHDSVVSGDPTLVDAEFGTGMELAGDYVELPATNDLEFGSGEFTAAMWFRSTDVTYQQALFWAYSRIDGEPKWWIRLEPDQNRIRGMLDNSSTTQAVTATGNFADGDWHHVALARDSTGLTLYVDGVAAGTAPAISGSVSGDPRTGIRVGARVDGVNNPLRGAADEVWLFDRALSASEVGTLASTNTGPAGATAIHLPLDEVECASGTQTTSDTSGQGNPGTVVGCAAPVTGEFGDAAELSYADHVEVADDTTIQVGTQPFTAAAWFRTDEDTDQAILWAHDVGAANPQWWVRLEPGLNRLRANLNNGTTTATLAAPGTFDDGEWHHVALVRGSGGLSLYVDGMLADTAAALSGSLSAGASYGIHIGQRVDGQSPLSGTVDEVWLVNQALTATQVGTLMNLNTAPSGSARLHLPLDDL
ncbi:sialidase family protein [Jiangella asiatica]|uniref:exo-alpha-sialidase n=1 Tax=Jiangella asiatica TaxID=2530372 RepID=A0A4R5DUB4_9ACTN|nr:sialidase family protein [Jiangella asiatica]TDE16054.1 hypothetical protein E1269_01865 [Jiangella asiatica]